MSDETGENLYVGDMENAKYQSMQGEIYSVYVNLDSMTSFMNPDIIKLGEKKIAEYIQNQLVEDQEYDQISMKEFIDPFTGEPVLKDKQ